MPLTFGDRRWYDEASGAVAFPAFNGGQRIVVRVTQEALRLVFDAGTKPDDLVETFDLCRASIEMAASMKFEADADALKLTLLISDFENRTAPEPEAKAAGPGDTAAMLRRFRSSAAGTAAKSERSVEHRGNLGAVMAALKARPLP